MTFNLSAFVEDQTLRRNTALKMDLNQELSMEIDRFVQCARRENKMEAVMRLRALTEISSQLDIERLLEVAVWVSSGSRGQHLQ